MGGVGALRSALATDLSCEVFTPTGLRRIFRIILRLASICFVFVVKNTGFFYMGQSWRIQ
jgi:hypothetical protein